MARTRSVRIDNTTPSIILSIVLLLLVLAVGDVAPVVSVDAVELGRAVAWVRMIAASDEVGSAVEEEIEDDCRLEEEVEASEVEGEGVVTIELLPVIEGLEVMLLGVAIELERLVDANMLDAPVTSGSSTSV